MPGPAGAAVGAAGGDPDELDELPELGRAFALDLVGLNLRSLRLLGQVVDLARVEPLLATKPGEIAGPLGASGQEGIAGRFRVGRQPGQASLLRCERPKGSPDFRARLLDVRDDLPVLAGEPSEVVEPRQRLVEGARTEEDCQGIGITVDVEGAQPFAELVFGESQRTAEDLKVAPCFVAPLSQLLRAGAKSRQTPLGACEAGLQCVQLEDGRLRAVGQGCVLGAQLVALTSEHPGVVGARTGRRQECHRQGRGRNRNASPSWKQTPAHEAATLARQRKRRPGRVVSDGTSHVS